MGPSKSTVKDDWQVVVHELELQPAEDAQTDAVAARTRIADSGLARRC